MSEIIKARNRRKRADKPEHRRKKVAIEKLRRERDNQMLYIECVLQPLYLFVPQTASPSYTLITRVEIDGFATDTVKWF